MSDSGQRNRLAEEASPYLRQHAGNPVDWQPWDEDALAEARERDVPIFLSVGYAACHWCHVMAEESFEDDAVAERLNEHFVPIKVDREERPDVDRVYQTVCQLVSGGGGWPLSAFLTPEGEPFYVGTYFPKEPKRGMPGFLNLLDRVADSWQDPEQRAEMENRASQWTAAARDRLEATPEGDDEPPGTDAIETATRAALQAADREHGGFGNGPKFPHPRRVDLLLRAHHRTGNEPALAVATETLDAMATGGLYDHVGGGFHRYCVDREWVVPHFEKMLYDNAELARIFLAGYQVTGEPRYALVAQETLAFVARELRHPGGGFHATLDAESETPASRLAGDAEPEREEGAFYVWRPDEVTDVVEDDLTATLLQERYGIDEAGNFEGNTTVPTVSATVDDLADAHDLDREAVRERLVAGRTALFEARSERPRPPRDGKVLAGWNGLMISAYAAGARVLDADLTDRAADALSFVRERLWDGERLQRRWLDGDVKGDGYLEDYAFLARGAFDTYQVTGDIEHLAFALDLAHTVVDEFYDADAGTLYFTPESGERLVTRPQELTDQSTPSSLGVATRLLLDLDAFAPEAEFEAVASDVLATHADRVGGSPLEHVSLALAADRHHRGALELTVAADEVPDAWREVLASRYLPDAILAGRPPTQEGLAGWLDVLDLAEAPPIWANREAVDGEPTVYACKGFTCSPPETDLRGALDWAERLFEDAAGDAEDLDGVGEDVPGELREDDPGDEE